MARVELQRLGKGKHRQPWLQRRDNEVILGEAHTSGPVRQPAHQVFIIMYSSNVPISVELNVDYDVVVEDDLEVVGGPPAGKHDGVLGEKLFKIFEILFNPVWPAVVDKPELTSG